MHEKQENLSRTDVEADKKFASTGTRVIRRGIGRIVNRLEPLRAVRN